MKQVKAYVVSNKRILPSGPHRAGHALASRLIHLHCPEIAGQFQPGQFVMVHCGYETILPRPFSVHQATKDSVVLFFAVLEGGKGSQWLSRRHKDEAVEIFGPLGTGFSIQPGVKNLLLVAGGMGLAPLCFLAHQAVREKRSATLLLGATIGPLYTERPGNLLPPGVEIATATEDGSSGYHGKVTDLIPRYIDWADQIFACGPLPMYRDTARRKQELKGKPVQISLEVRMGCGVGACYGCTVKTKSGLRKVCEDGPIFDLDDVLWDEMADI